MAEAKRCLRCGLTKPISEFSKDKRRPDGCKSHCKECHNKYNKKWCEENPDKFKDRKERYVETHRVQINDYAKKYREKHPEKRKEYRDRYRRNLKIEVISHYCDEEIKCVCCGETILEFLTIDHINNNGAEHRRRVGPNIYNWLKKNNYPNGYQVLCMNCNWGKRVNGGICPHKDEKKCPIYIKQKKAGKIGKT
jgi:hypothetical protein